MTKKPQCETCSDKKVMTCEAHHMGCPCIFGWFACPDCYSHATSQMVEMAQTQTFDELIASTEVVQKQDV